jgi:hypothetical protein
MMCRICKREIERQDLTTTDFENPEKAVYHKSFGVVCLAHKGVKEHYKELLRKATRVS